MSRLSLELPTLQNWSCHNCSGCCRQHGIFITEEERLRIESQKWTAADGVCPDQPLYVKAGSPRSKHPWRLSQQTDGSCVFLDERGLCRIHGKFGEAAKPFACRIYPYAFHPAGDKIAVSLRFSCPSVASNRGETVVSQEKELREIAARLVPPNHRDIPPPKLTDKVQLDWADTLHIVHRLDATFADDQTPVAMKLLRALFWIDLIEQTRFEKIRGERLGELLDLLTAAAVVEVPGGPENRDQGRGERVESRESRAKAETATTLNSPPLNSTPPSKIGLSQFRLLAGQYARQDTFASMQQGLAGRWRMLRFALRLTSGRGTLPALSDDLRETPFAALERPFGGLSMESEELFTRYFRVKIQGLHFFGRAYYDTPLVEGWYSLALVLPATLWIARWRAASAGRDRLIHDDVLQALMLVDHNHGYSDAFGTWSSRRRVKNLVRLGDLNKLVTWYAD